MTLELLLRAHGRWPAGETPVDTFVIAITPEVVPVAFEVVEKLRGRGVSADLDLMGRTLPRQLREAARRGARRALLIGPKELARGMIVERDLTTGVQRELPRAGVGAPDGPGGPNAPDGASAPPAPA